MKNLKQILFLMTIILSFNINTFYQKDTLENNFNVDIYDPIIEDWQS